MSKQNIVADVSQVLLAWLMTLHNAIVIKLI